LASVRIGASVLLVALLFAVQARNTALEAAVAIWRICAADLPTAVGASGPSEDRSVYFPDHVDPRRPCRDFHALPR
jgi:hypothetical protein